MKRPKKPSKNIFEDAYAWIKFHAAIQEYCDELEYQIEKHNKNESK